MAIQYFGNLDNELADRQNVLKEDAARQYRGNRDNLNSLAAAGGQIASNIERYGVPEWMGGDGKGKEDLEFAKMEYDVGRQKVSDNMRSKEFAMKQLGVEIDTHKAMYDRNKTVYQNKLWMGGTRAGALESYEEKIKVMQDDVEVDDVMQKVLKYPSLYKEDTVKKVSNFMRLKKSDGLGDGDEDALTMAIQSEQPLNFTNWANKNGRRSLEVFPDPSREYNSGLSRIINRNSHLHGIGVPEVSSEIANKQLVSNKEGDKKKVGGGILDLVNAEEKVAEEIVAEKKAAEVKVAEEEGVSTITPQNFADGKIEYRGNRSYGTESKVVKEGGNEDVEFALNNLRAKEIYNQTAGITAHSKSTEVKAGKAGTAAANVLHDTTEKIIKGGKKVWENLTTKDFIGTPEEVTSGGADKGLVTEQIKLNGNKRSIDLAIARVKEEVNKQRERKSKGEYNTLTAAKVFAAEEIPLLEEELADINYDLKGLEVKILQSAEDNRFNAKKPVSENKNKIDLNKTAISLANKTTGSYNPIVTNDIVQNTMLKEGYGVFNEGHFYFDGNNPDNKTGNWSKGGQDLVLPGGLNMYDNMTSMSYNEKEDIADQIFGDNFSKKKEFLRYINMPKEDHKIKYATHEQRGKLKISGYEQNIATDIMLKKHLGELVAKHTYLDKAMASYPKELQSFLLDLSFNMGSSWMKKFKKFEGHLKSWSSNPNKTDAQGMINEFKNSEHFKKTYADKDNNRTKDNLEKLETLTKGKG
jgi:hypothetical protein